jgi:hypothetical protein
MITLRLYWLRARPNQRSAIHGMRTAAWNGIELVALHPSCSVAHERELRKSDYFAFI